MTKLRIIMTERERKLAFILLRTREALDTANVRLKQAELDPVKPWLDTGPSQYEEDCIKVIVENEI